MRNGILFYLFSFALVLTLTTSIGCSSKGKGGSGEIDENLISEQNLAGQRFGDGNIPRGSDQGPLGDVRFDYDSAAIRPEDMEIIRNNAKFLTADPTLHAEVEGHCDRRGTNEYNLALGEERAKSAARALVNLGVRPSQISTISYGEEIPLDPSDSEYAFSKNRRAHFVVYNKSKGS